MRGEVEDVMDRLLKRSQPCTEVLSDNLGQLHVDWNGFAFVLPSLEQHRAPRRKLPFHDLNITFHCPAAFAGSIMPPAKRKGTLMGNQITIDNDGGILRLTMNRPDKKNALTQEMYGAMADVMASAENDLSVRVILFAGSEGNFSAGNDLNDFRNNPPRGPDAPVFRFITGLAKSTVPMIAAVDGFAIGVGTTMLLHCDMVFLSEDAQLQMPFVDLGLVPEAGSSYLLPKLMGHARAAELVMTGRMIDARNAMELGIANRICTPDDVHAAAMATARTLAAKPPQGLRTTKALLKSDRDQVVAQLERESAEFSRRLASDECREALTAFAEKRPPDFSKVG